MRFEGKGEIKPFRLVNYFAIQGRRGSYQTTLKMWIYREHLSSTMGKVYFKPDGEMVGREDEILFNHQDLMKIVFFKDSSNFLSVYCGDDKERLIQV